LAFDSLLIGELDCWAAAGSAMQNTVAESTSRNTLFA